MSVFRVFAALLLAAAAGCAPQPSPARAAAVAETAALAPLRAKYDGTVTGFDVRGATVLVALDLQKYAYMDPDETPRFRSDILGRWRAAWAAQHPHQHAALTVRFIDYLGRTVATQSTRV